MNLIISVEVQLEFWVPTNQCIECTVFQMQFAMKNEGKKSDKNGSRRQASQRERVSKGESEKASAYIEFVSVSL